MPEKAFSSRRWVPRVCTNRISTSVQKRLNRGRRGDGCEGVGALDRIFWIRWIIWMRGGGRRLREVRVCAVLGGFSPASYPKNPSIQKIRSKTIDVRIPPARWRAKHGDSIVSTRVANVWFHAGLADRMKPIPLVGTPTRASSALTSGLHVSAIALPALPRKTGTPAAEGVARFFGKGHRSSAPAGACDNLGASLPTAAPGYGLAMGYFHAAAAAAPTLAFGSRLYVGHWLGKGQ